MFGKNHKHAIEFSKAHDESKSENKNLEMATRIFPRHREPGWRWSRERMSCKMNPDLTGFEMIDGKVITVYSASTIEPK